MKNHSRFSRILLGCVFLALIPTWAACTQPETVSPEQLHANLQAELQGELTHLIWDYRDQAGTVFVRWDLAGDSTNARIAKSAKEDTAIVLKNLFDSNQPFEKVIVSGWHYWTVDINGTLDYNEFFRLEYTPETLDEINWGSLRSDYIWLIADRGEIHWLLDE